MTADLADLQLVWPGSLSYFYLFFFFLVIWATLSFTISCAYFLLTACEQHSMESQRGQEETRPVQLAFAPDSRKGGAEILERQWRFFSVMSNSLLAPVLDIALIYLEAFLALACPVSWSHRSYFLFQNKFQVQSSSVVFGCFYPHPLNSLFL